MALYNCIRKVSRSPSYSRNVNQALSIAFLFSSPFLNCSVMLLKETFSRLPNVSSSSFLSLGVSVFGFGTSNLSSM